MNNIGSWIDSRGPTLKFFVVCQYVVNNYLQKDRDFFFFKTSYTGNMTIVICLFFRIILLDTLGTVKSSSLKEISSYLPFPFIY